MSLVDRLNREIEEIDQFYGNSHESAIGDQINRVKKHRFLLYSNVIDLPWKAAWMGSLVVSLFDDGKYNSEKLMALALAAPTIPISSAFYGAFWARLGSGDLLKESWKKSKWGTIRKVAYYVPLGNLMHWYYKFHVITDLLSNVAYESLGRISKKSEALSRLVLRTMDAASEFSMFYSKHIMPRIT